MKHSLIALGCALALAGGSALAAQDAGQAPAKHESTATHDSSSGGGFVEKTKEAFHKLGQSVKNGFHRAENKVDDAKADHKDDTRAMGASGTAKDDTDRQKRMDDAYGNYKKSGPADKTTSK